MSEYCKNCYELAEQLHRYKQVIKEIKEIANKDFGHTSWEEYAKQLKQIIHKCEELNK